VVEAESNSLTLLGIFFMGLGLNLTPCVYPMLSVTVSLFTAQRSASRGKSFVHALAYVLGMATMYSSLGVATAFTGGFFGAFLQNKIVLLAIAALLFLLALSMFGLYTLTPPAALLNKLASRKAAGTAGFYISGLFVGLFAAPCVGPPVLALLAFVGSKADPVFGFLVFFIMSMGLGLPYLLLGTFSGLLGKLPRSGVWLIWVERLFGVVLLAVSVFYLLLALKPDAIRWVVPAALIAGGVYLGFLERSGNQSPRFAGFKKAAGIMAITAGLLMPVLMPKEGVVWDAYSQAKVDAAIAAGQPVVLDFYADWCIPCHELDQFTYTNPEVIKSLAPFARFKVDLTAPEGDEINDTIDRFEILGVPTVLFLDEEGREVREARITGFVPAKDFMTVLRGTRLKKYLTA
jgi:thioredoxin:protein disulfide reductase